MLVIYPFSPHTKRMRWYGIFTLFLSLASAVLSISETNGSTNTPFYPYLITAECFLLGMAAIVSCIVAGIRLYSAGVSEEVRRLIFVRHILFIFTFILCNVYFFL